MRVHVPDDEAVTGEQPRRSRLRRGKRSQPLWSQIDTWRLRWQRENVTEVVRLLEQGVPPDEIAAATGLQPLHQSVDGEDRTFPDLNGFDLLQLAPEDLRRVRSAEFQVRSDLSHYQFQGARLTGMNLSNADLFRADLRKATLRRVNLASANLGKAHVEDADLRDANVAGARMGFLRYSRDGWLKKGTIFREMLNLPLAHYADPVLERYIKDQEYVYVYKDRARGMRKVRERLWWLTSNYGQSVWVWACWCVLVIMLFAVAYVPVLAEPKTGQPPAVDGHAARLLVPSGESAGFLSALYFSVVTFTTLGFGDIRPANPTAQVVVTVEVVIGYIMFGVLISILGNLVARRA